MSDITVKVEGVSKKFCKTLKHTMIYGSTDLARSFMGIKGGTEKLRAEEFWAVDDVSFEVKRGEVFGIIGSNGSGKSTLLKMLNGIFMPDRGRIEIEGKVGALIEVGSGFHPMLSGRENIYVNGAILGLSKRDIDKKFDEIVDFSGVEEFLDSPVKHYSSGMFVRLGFSVAVHCRPEVLLVDEVLSVGDMSFKMKSHDKMMEIVNGGATVIFVSHDLMGVEQICDRVAWLERSKINKIGEKKRMLQDFILFQKKKASVGGECGGAYVETGLVKIDGCGFVGEGQVSEGRFGYNERLIVKLHYDAVERVEHPYFRIYVKVGNSYLLGANMLADGREPEVLEGRGTLDVDFGNVPFYPGSYKIFVEVRRDSHVCHFSLKQVGVFHVEAPVDSYGFTGKFAGSYGSAAGIALPYEYTWGKKEEKD